MTQRVSSWRRCGDSSATPPTGSVGGPGRSLRRRCGRPGELSGAYRDGEQIGFARAVSDGRALAYLADVYVLEQHRMRGLGTAMVRGMIDGGPGAGFRWMLHTLDGHDFYRRLGCDDPPETLMERPGRSPRPHLPDR
jgi:GNAT superfamily N-acetyltransferase